MLRSISPQRFVDRSKTDGFKSFVPNSDGGCRTGIRFIRGEACARTDAVYPLGFLRISV